MSVGHCITDPSASSQPLVKIHSMGCALSRLRNNKRAKCYHVDGRQQSDDRVTEQQDPADSSTLTAADAEASCHKEQHSTPAKRAHHEPASTNKPAVPQAIQKAKLDPQDFMYTGLQSETQVKLPGSIKGQQFIIDNCKDCNLFVMDHCASVTIDDCTNCRIFIGPTEASVFMRDCHNCSLATITRQLRCRDCSSCNLLLLVRTRPIIESSSSMAFGCFDMPYAGLGAQMAAAQLSPFHNFWSSVFDFTPAAAGTAAAAGAGQQQAASNWRLLPGSASVQQLLGDPALPEAVQQLLSASSAEEAAAAAASASVGTAAAAAAAAAVATEGEVLGAADMAAAAALSQADCMCVIHTSRQQVQQQEPGAGSSCSRSSSLFVMFPAGQHMAALQWVHSNITQQQHQQQQAPQCQEQQPDAGAAVEEPPTTADASPADVNVSCRAFEPVEAAAPAAAVVLYTNEASIPAAVLQQMATAAAWSKQQLKQLGVTAAVKGKAGACVGLEAACSTEEVRQQLCSSAEAAGALCCTSTAAAALFRDLGVDG